MANLGFSNEIFVVTYKKDYSSETKPLTWMRRHNGWALNDTGAAGTFFYSRPDAYKAIRQTKRLIGVKLKYRTRRLLPIDDTMGD